MDCPICGNTNCEQVQAPGGGEIIVAESTELKGSTYFDDVDAYVCRDNRAHVFYVSQATDEWK